MLNRHKHIDLPIHQCVVHIIFRSCLWMTFHWRGNLRGQEWLSKDKWLVRDCLIWEGWYFCVKTWVCNWVGVYNGQGGAWEFHWLWEELSGITWVTWLWKREAGEQYLRNQVLLNHVFFYVSVVSWFWKIIDAEVNKNTLLSSPISNDSSWLHVIFLFNLASLCLRKTTEKYSALSPDVLRSFCV